MREPLKEQRADGAGVLGGQAAAADPVDRDPLYEADAELVSAIALGEHGQLAVGRVGAPLEILAFAGSRPDPAAAIDQAMTLLDQGWTTAAARRDPETA